MLVDVLQCDIKALLQRQNDELENSLFYSLQRTLRVIVQVHAMLEDKDNIGTGKAIKVALAKLPINKYDIVRTSTALNHHEE